MCNEFQQKIALKAYYDLMASLNIGTPAEQFELDLPQADSIRIGQAGAVVTLQGNGVGLSQMTFAFPPAGRGGPVFNYRSEGFNGSEPLDFSNHQRCLIPASGFYEFKGEKTPKAKYLFTPVSDPLLAIAGLWKTVEGRDYFTMLTTAPGADIAPYHDRQIVLVPPAHFGDWLYNADKAVLAPAPAGTLKVELIRRGKDWPPEGELF
jgi:putative SOS response-associated peptidase YedK